jgi:hypothetical protein
MEHRARLAKEVGKQVEVSVLILDISWSTHSFVSRQVLTNGVKVTWEVVKPQSETKDFFPSEEGPAGTKGDRKRQTLVLQDFELTGAADEYLQVWLRLYPFRADIARMNIALRTLYPNEKRNDLTLHEFVKWVGLPYASR